MSKSYGNIISLFAEDTEIKKAVMSIPTDSKGVSEPKDPEKDNVFALHKLFAAETELALIERRYKEGGLGYKESKEILISNIQRFIAPLRDRRKEIAADEDAVRTILERGAEHAREIVHKKMEEVRKAVGVA